MPPIQSMTAFARRESAHEWGTLAWELRSVNHRYLEVSLRLPELARNVEAPARDRLRERLGRGKVDGTLRVQLEDAAGNSLDIDEALLARLVAACRRVESIAGGAMPGSLELLRWPGVIREAGPDLERITAAALELLDRAAAELVAMRSREGANLADFLRQRLDAIEALCTTQRRMLPDLLAAYRQRLAERVAQVRADVDPARIEQEIVLLAARSDVAEELDRLASHVHEARRSLQDGGACGRRLDFLMQEFNREANTLASKSITAETTQCALELKVLIEQMREQVQNIE